MMPNNFLQNVKEYFPEYLWLSVAVLGSIVAIHATVVQGAIRQTFIFYIIVATSFFMYWVRRKLRTRRKINQK